VNTDSALYTGKTHSICQDYVINGQQNANTHYIFLADGCSGSNQTDVGARILCHTNKFYLPFSTSFDGIKIDNEKIMHSAHIACGVIGINSECLDATMISVVNSKEIIKVNILGDGVVALKDKEGLLRIISFEYSENYPFYLNYKHPSNQERYKKWLEEKQKHIFDVSVLDLTSAIKTSDNPDALFSRSDNDSTIATDPEHTKISICPDYYDFVAVISDGVKSFYKIDTLGRTTTLNHLNIVYEILNFKNTKGEFVKRRLNKFKKECEKNKIYHYDDVSLGVMYLK